MSAPPRIAVLYNTDYDAEACATDVISVEASARAVASARENVALGRAISPPRIAFTTMRGMRATVRRGETGAAVAAAASSLCAAARSPAAAFHFSHIRFRR